MVMDILIWVMDILIWAVALAVALAIKENAKIARELGDKPRSCGVMLEVAS